MEVKLSVALVGHGARPVTRRVCSGEKRLSAPLLTLYSRARLVVCNHNLSLLCSGTHNHDLWFLPKRANSSVSSPSPAGSRDK